MTPLQQHWTYLATKHDLEVTAPFILSFDDGGEITVDVLLHGYGSENGMLLITDYSKVRNRTDEIVNMGYGFSCLSEPNKNEIQSDEGLDEILTDWEKTK